ncbi:MAG: hypothetical protein U0798_17910 [Gemmataceae bacterium]
MLNHERLLLAIEIQSKSYKLLRWIGRAIDEQLIPLGRAERHSETPDAAVDWITQYEQYLPQELKPGKTQLREFANFFWTYLTSSFDIVERPDKRLLPGRCGCSCPMCARITHASHLQPKKLTKADKQRAMDLMVGRLIELAVEENLTVTPKLGHEIASHPETRRSCGFSAYGHWLIQRLSGITDGPAILALWREIAWNKTGSPIQGFSLRAEEFETAEKQLINTLLGENEQSKSNNSLTKS